MRCCLLFAGCVATTALFLPAQPLNKQKPPKFDRPAGTPDDPLYLFNMQPVTLQGTLTMSPAGRLQFVTVTTAETYVPVTQDEHGRNVNGDPLRGVSLTAPLPYALLYKHRGKRVTVKGHMQTDANSPYFWHQTRLAVTSLRLADGLDLLEAAAPPKPPLPATLQDYSESITLPADLAAPWQYRFAAPVSQAFAPDSLLTCSSNGGGDVVNCDCAIGFHATAGKAVLQGRQVPGTLDVAAQFDVSDHHGNVAFPVTLAVTCSR